MLPVYLWLISSLGRNKFIFSTAGLALSTVRRTHIKYRTYETWLLQWPIMSHEEEKNRYMILIAGILKGSKYIFHYALVRVNCLIPIFVMKKILNNPIVFSPFKKCIPPIRAFFVLCILCCIWPVKRAGPTFGHKDAWFLDSS